MAKKNGGSSSFSSSSSSGAGGKKKAGGTNSSNKSNLKQGNLFSFFSKSIKKATTTTTPKQNTNTTLPIPPSASKNGSNSSTTSKPSAPIAAAPAAPASTTKNSNAMIASLPSREAHQNKKNHAVSSKNKLWTKLKVGSKIGIYWDDDKCYYPCTVEGREEANAANSSSSSSSSRFFVRYDDGESEWTDMAQEKLRWLDDEDDNEEDNDNEAGTTSTTGKQTTKKRNHRSIDDDDVSDDDDEEEQEWKDPGDTVESDDDDESVFDETVDAEEEEEADDWMVTDDEEEEIGTKKKKKTATKKKKIIKITHHEPRSVVVNHASAAVASTTTTTPSPFAKRMKASSSSTSSPPFGAETNTKNETNSNAYKTPLKNFAFNTVSPRTASLQKANSNPASTATTRMLTQPNKRMMTTPPPSSKTQFGTGTGTGRTVESATTIDTSTMFPHMVSRGILKPLPMNCEKGAVNVCGAHLHNHMQFLRYPKDAQGRARDHPAYDRRTLLVNEHEWKRLNENKEMSPATKQWWDLKAQYFDTVFLFKTGKFYEMFHQDADIGVELLDHIYMKGKVAHSGFPEVSYGEFADKLVRAGYKVARIEQTETPDMLKERNTQMTKGKKKAKVVNREVCSIMTLGTRTYCSLDVDLFSQEKKTNGDSTAGGPLLVIREVVYDSKQLKQQHNQEGNMEDNSDDDDDDDDTGTQQAVCEYGVTLIDAIRGTVTLGMFADDVLRNRMSTLLVSFHPSEILVQGQPTSSQNTNDTNKEDGNGASKELMSLLKSYEQDSQLPCQIETIHIKEVFPKSTALNKNHAKQLERGEEHNRGDKTVRPWNIEETLHELHRKRYYPRSSRKKDNQNQNPMTNPTKKESVSRWPVILKTVVEGEANLCLSSFGAALFYLQRNMIDREILSMNIVRAYIPPPPTSSSNAAIPSSQPQQLIKSNDDNDAPMYPATPNTNSIDNFWSSQKLSQESSSSSFALERLEENPLYKIPTSTPMAPPIEYKTINNGSAMDTSDEASTADGAAATTISAVTVAASAEGEDQITHMTLDGTTLHNLEILTNATDYRIAGSLWGKINFTKCSHGSRMLRAWLLRPLFKKADIDRRADAVEELKNGAAHLSLTDCCNDVLCQIPDLDRLLNRVHSMSVGIKDEIPTDPTAAVAVDDDDIDSDYDYDDDDDADGISSNQYHPNKRAVLFEGPKYTKRKVTDFKNLLEGLKKTCQIPELFADVDLDRNGLVYRLVRLGKDGGLFPDMVDTIDWFFENFDCDSAAKGEYEPKPGMDPLYDRSCDDIFQIKADLESYKQDMIENVLKPRHVAQRAWKYINIKPNSKDKYLIELPVDVRVPEDFLVKAKRGAGQKTINKYSTPIVLKLVKDLEQAYEVQEKRRAKLIQMMFAKFNKQRPLWSAAAHATAILDALGSLAVLAATNQNYCRPEILSCPPNVQPVINIVQGRHPVVEFDTSSEFIPNDLHLGQRRRGTTGSNYDNMNVDVDDNMDADSSRLLLLSGTYHFFKLTTVTFNVKTCYLHLFVLFVICIFFFPLFRLQFHPPGPITIITLIELT